jgi:flavorubredoxin
MWQSTEHMTIPLSQGIKDAGVDVDVIKLRATPMSVAITRVGESRAMLVGSPTLNNILFPSVAEFLTHLRGLRPKNRLAGAFGSYGWGGGAVKEAYAVFKQMALETVEPGVEVVYRPGSDDEKNATTSANCSERRLSTISGSGSPSTLILNLKLNTKIKQYQ